jgi:predicted DNA-binding protein
MAPADPLPFTKFRLSEEVKRRIRTRAAYNGVTASDYIAALVMKDTEDFFQRIDREKVKNGGKS